MGRMPYVDIIYEKADDETKKNLKLASVGFWECHVKEKFHNCSYHFFGLVVPELSFTMTDAQMFSQRKKLRI